MHGPDPGLARGAGGTGQTAPERIARSAAPAEALFALSGAGMAQYPEVAGADDPRARRNPTQMTEKMA